MADSFQDAPPVVCSLDFLADPDGVFGVLEKASEEDVGLVVISLSHSASWFEERLKDTEAGKKLEAVVDATTDHFHLSAPSSFVPFSVLSVRSPVRLEEMLAQTASALRERSGTSVRIVLDSASAVLAYNGRERAIAFFTGLAKETKRDDFQAIVLVSSGSGDSDVVKEAFGDVVETEMPVSRNSS